MIEPSSRSLQGSQQIPFIYSDLCSDKDWLDSYEKMYRMSWEERKILGMKGSEWVRREFSLSRMINSWDNAFETYINKYRQGNQTRVKVGKV